MRAIVMILIALVVAMGTAVGARNWLIGQKQTPTTQVAAPVPTKLIKILAAAEDLPAGTILQERHLAWVNWPEEALVENYLTETNSQMNEFVGAVVRHQTLAHAPLVRNRLVKPGDRGFLSAVLNPGHHAVSVPVDATSGIAGFVFPGDQVDVILTFKLEDPGPVERHASQVILTDVRVIAIDQATDNPDGKVKVAKTATLEVTPKGAEKIALALKVGGLSLALRSLGRPEGEEFEAANDGVAAQGEGDQDIVDVSANGDAVADSTADDANYANYTLQSDLSPLFAGGVEPLVVDEPQGEAVASAPKLIITRGGAKGTSREEKSF